MLKSGIVLAGGNMAPKMYDRRGVVTGLEIQNLNLNNTDLVVLSACETGLGDVNEAEGVSGLNKAFMQAGAKGTIMTLWSVADEQSAELISSFYTNVKQTNNNYSKSLKDAKLDMIKQNYHPYFWSAFIFSGGG